MNRGPREASEDLPPTRPCFPTFTAIEVLALLLLVGISWLRDGRTKLSKPSLAEPSGHRRPESGAKLSLGPAK